MKFLLSIMLAAVVLVLGVLALPLMVNLNHYEARYRPFMEDMLNRKISIEDIRLMIIPRLGIRVEGVTVMDDPAFSTAPFASFHALEVGVKIAPLFARRIEVEEVILRDPVITVIRNSKGLINLSTLGQRAPTVSTKGPPRIFGVPALEQVELTGGKLVYSDRMGSQPKEYVADDLGLIMKSVKVGDIAGLHLSAVIQPLNLPVTVDGSLGPLQTTATLEDFDFAVRSGDAVATIKGSAAGGAFKLRLASQVINSDELSVSLPLTKPVKVRDLQLSVETVYPLQEGVPLRNAVTQAKLDFELDLGKSTIIVTGGGKSGDFNLDVSSGRLDAADLPFKHPLGESIRIKDLKFQAEAAYPAADGRTLQDAITVNTLTFDVITDASILAVKGSGPSSNFKLTASSESIQSTELPLAVLLKKPILFKSLDLAMEVHQPLVQISNLTFNMVGGHAQGSGETTIGTHPLPFDGRMMLKNIHLGPLMEAISNSPIIMTGIADVQLAFNWTGQSFADLMHGWTASGHLSATDGTLDGINVLKEAMTVAKSLALSFDATNTTPFDKLDATFHSKGEVIHLDRFQLRNRVMDASATGTIGFNQSVDLKARATLLGKQVTVPVVMGGTLKAPTYSLDTGAIGTSLKKMEAGAVSALLKGGKASQEFIKQGTETIKHLVVPEPGATRPEKPRSP